MCVCQCFYIRQIRRIYASLMRQCKPMQRNVPNPGIYPWTLANLRHALSTYLNLRSPEWLESMVP